MKLLFILLFISFISFSQTQEATIFFNDGEAFEGYAGIKNNKIKFRISLEDKAEILDYKTISKIKFYGFEMSKTFEYLKIKENAKPILIELVSKGVVSLYKQESTYWTGTNSHTTPSEFGSIPSGAGLAHRTSKTINYLKRETDKLPTCLNGMIFNKWKKTTMVFLSDCPTLIDKIKTNEFREIHLQEIVEYYNDFCTEL